MKCEHGLKIKECYVCMSPKYGKHDTKQESVANPQEKRHEWVGLTDEEIKAIANPSDDEQIPMTGRMWVFVANLMEAIKEKNT